MSKIKMLESTPGTVDEGLTVVLYKKGLVYNTEDMSEEVVETFLGIGVAEKHITPPEVDRHQKGLSGAPENKRVVVPENKTTNKRRRNK